MLLRHVYSIVGIVDHIHRRIGYQGGRLALRDVFECVPGLLLAQVDPSALPPGASAAMERVSGCVRIAVDASLSRAEQRVAIAHEIGHALLHAGHVFEALPPEEESVREEQAERFAEELLAPRWALAQAPGALPGARISFISRHFEITQELATRRIALLRAIAASRHANASARRRDGNRDRQEALAGAQSTYR